MAGFEEQKDELAALGVSVVAASVDGDDKAGEVAAELSFPIGYEVTRADAELLSSWWEERRQIIQPSEFLLNAEHKIMAASYSDGPIGRIDAADVIKVVNFYEAQKQK